MFTKNVIVLPYDEQWKHDFLQIKAEITNALGQLAIEIEHEMTKRHYISFVAAFSSDGLQMIKLYPQGAAEARLKIQGVKRIYCFCNKDGLFYIDINKNIAGRK